jgi:hypothetical protein
MKHKKREEQVSDLWYAINQIERIVAGVRQYVKNNDHVDMDFVDSELGRVWTIVYCMRSEYDRRGTEE